MYFMNAMDAIYAEGLTKRYGDTLALDRLELSVAPGEVYGYLGPNGAGKTTTIRLLLGLTGPTRAARAVGIGASADPVDSTPPGGLRRRRAVPMAVAYRRGDAGVPRPVHGSSDGSLPGRVVRALELEPRKSDAPVKGNRQRLSWSALATRADLLVLDEPTSGLDPLMEMAFRQCDEEAKARGQAVLLSSHILSEVEALCDRVGILRHGRLVDEGTLAQLRHLRGQTVEVTFNGPAPKMPSLPGVAVQHVGDNGLRFQTTEGVGPVIAPSPDIQSRRSPAGNRR